MDPNTPYRTIEALTFPGMNHAATIPIKEGHMERKKRYTKSYHEGESLYLPGKSEGRGSDTHNHSLLRPLGVWIPARAPLQRRCSLHQTRLFALPARVLARTCSQPQCKGTFT